MEAQMVAYWVARSKVNNPTQYKKYTDLVPSILQSLAEELWRAAEGSRSSKARKDSAASFSSSSRASRRRSLATNSPEYLEAALHRRKEGASELEIAIVEGIGRDPS
jgi:uncharacterized protein (DUF1330 family)